MILTMSSKFSFSSVLEMSHRPDFYCAYDFRFS